MNRMSGLVLGLLALLIAGSPAAQTAYPARPIHLVVGFSPGSAPDIIARLLGEQFSAALEKPVVVENLPGAAANIAAERIAKAAPDGYTLGLLGQSIVVNPSLYRLAYDPVKDFAPVSQVAVSPYILTVHNAVPATSVKDLVALAKAHAGGLTFATGGSGSAPRIASELFESAADLDIRHIPYKGVVAAIPDVLAGRVAMMFSPIVGVLPLAREGKLRALAVTSLKRSPAASELPSIAESGYSGVEIMIWYGLLVPASYEGFDYAPAPFRATLAALPFCLYGDGAPFCWKPTRAPSPYHRIGGLFAAKRLHQAGVRLIRRAVALRISMKRRAAADR